MEFSKEALDTVNKIIRRYPEGKQKSALLPVLHLAQAEFDGWLSTETMDYVASLLSIKPIEVYEVVSFYTMFNLEPVGKCLIEVCQTGPCWLRGSDDVITYLEKKLGIKQGETTPDGMFTIKAVECLGSCGTAPMLQCGGDYHENLTEEKLDHLVEHWKTSDKRSSYLRSNPITQ